MQHLLRPLPSLVQSEGYFFAFLIYLKQKLIPVWLLALLLIQLPYLGLSQCFNPSTNVDLGNGSAIGPYSIAIADFNGDGKADLATANLTVNTVSVLLGNGSGSFGSATNFNVDSGPRSVATGDFNGDGKTDLATANYNDNTISVLLGNGNGGFSPAISFGVGVRPRFITVGDFNRDNKLDLTVANYNDNTVSVLLGNGNGAFGSATNFSVENGPFSVAVGDFNKDGKADLVIANFFSNSVSLLLGDGSGSFGSAINFSVGIRPTSVAVGDFNGDANPDLAVTNSFENTVSVLMGNGNGSLSSPTNFNLKGDSPNSLLVVDFNSDGDSDLAVSNSSSHSISVLMSNNNGSFNTATIFNVGNGPFSAAAGDFNGDNKPDLITANYTDNTASLLLNCVGLPNTAPQPTVNTNQTVTLGNVFSYTVNAFTDAETPKSLTHTATISPANGLSFDALTRVISGTPISSGASSVTITVTDPDGLSASTSFTITVCTPSPEYAVLAEFYKATNGPNWINKTNWLANCDPCSWYGVTCTNGRVRSLDLSYNNLNGNLPASLSTLTNLIYFRMYGNQLSGTLPASLGSLTNLQEVNLQHNNLSGTIPASFSALTSLYLLDLQNNQLNGSIPVSLSALSSLQSLFLNDNQLSGSIPTLPNLQSIYLNNNQLSGSVPASLSKLTNLVTLYLNANQLSGCFPASLSALCGKYIYFFNNPGLPGGGDFDSFCANGAGSCSSTHPTDNQTAIVGSFFSYTVSAFMTPPNTLTYTADINPANGLSFDPTTRIISGTPLLPGVSSVTITAVNADGISASTSFGITAIVVCPDNAGFETLTDLYNATNGPNWTRKDNWLTNCNPCGWYGIGCNDNGQIITISLPKNQLKGSIPASLSALTSLQTLDLSANQLSGIIPASLSVLTKLKELILSSNQLNGSIPTNLATLTTLQYLSLGRNQLSGSIPTTLSALSTLQILELSSNQLTGTIPFNLGELSNLTYLGLNDNRLTGTIPTSIGSLTRLVSLELEKNQLTGSIPVSLGNLTNLQELTIHLNQLSGNIPAGLGNLPNLVVLLLYSNQLSGCIPASLSALCRKAIYLFDNPGLPGGGDFAAFCTNGTGRGNGQISASATSASVGNVLSLSASGGASYKWMAPIGALLSNPTTNSVVSATLINSGTQTFTVSVSNGVDCSQQLPLSIDVTNAPMPVNLISFTAQAINEQTIQLDWITASEQNNKYFLLERSKDLVQVEPVAQLKAHEGSSFQGFTYTYTDDKPYSGTSYYRLRQVDLDGKTTTYPWASVVLRREAYSVSPNPISNQQFRLQLDEPLTATITLYSLDGRLMPIQKISSNAGSLQLKTTQKLPTGIYILTVEERAQTREYRLVVE